MFERCLKSRSFSEHQIIKLAFISKQVHIYNSVSAVNYDSSGAWAEVPASTIQKDLTGTDVGDSISEDLDTTTSTPIDTSDYDDVFILSVFRLRQTIFTDLPGVALEATRAEGYVGCRRAPRHRNGCLVHRRIPGIV